MPTRPPTRLIDETGLRQVPGAGGEHCQSQATKYLSYIEKCGQTVEEGALLMLLAQHLQRLSKKDKNATYTISWGFLVSFL